MLGWGILLRCYLQGFLCGLPEAFEAFLWWLARRHSSLRLTVSTRLFDVATTVAWCLYASYASVCASRLSPRLLVSPPHRPPVPLARYPDRCTLPSVCASWCLYSSQRLHASFRYLVFTRLLVSPCLLVSPRLLPAVCTPLRVSTPILPDVTSGIYTIQDCTYP